MKIIHFDMIERNISPKVFDILSKEDLNRIAPAIAVDMYEGRATDIIIKILTNEFDSKRYKTTSSPKHQGGWRKHTYKINVSAKGSYHVMSKPNNTKKLYIENERPSSYYYSPPDILSPIYRELSILEGKIIIENLLVKNEKDLSFVIERFNEITTQCKSSIDKKKIIYVLCIDAQVENDKELLGVIEMLTELTVLKFAPDNEKIKINYSFNINVAKAVKLEGIPIKAGIYNGNLSNQYSFKLNDENSKEVSFDYKVPQKSYFANQVFSYTMENLISNKIRKSRWGMDYLRPDETNKLCSDDLNVYTIDKHTFVRNLQK